MCSLMIVYILRSFNFALALCKVPVEDLLLNFIAVKKEARIIKPHSEIQSVSLFLVWVEGRDSDLPPDEILSIFFRRFTSLGRYFFLTCLKSVIPI